MKVVIGLIVVVMAVVYTGVAKRDLVAEEVRGWMELLPRIIVRMAAMRLDANQRISIYREEWLPELLYKTRQAHGRPITRFLTGTRYALGLLRASRRVARELRHVQRNELARTWAASPEPRVLQSRGIFGDSPIRDIKDLVEYLNGVDVVVTDPSSDHVQVAQVKQLLPPRVLRDRTARNPGFDPKQFGGGSGP